MSYLVFNEKVFPSSSKKKSSFFIGNKDLKKKKEKPEKKIKPKIINKSIIKHIQDQSKNTNNHNPDPITPLKRDVLK